MPRGKSYQHQTSIEASFAGMARRRGWEVHRSGWPDFMVERDGELLFVECKSTNDNLRPSQRKLFAALEKAGIHVKVWWEHEPESLMPWRKFPSRRAKYWQERARVSELNRKVRNGYE